MKAVEAFRYRAQDVLLSITDKFIKNVRKEEIKNEILASEQLKEHFAKRPDQLLRLKQKSMHFQKKLKQHGVTKKAMTWIPDYLVPKGMGAIVPPQTLNKKRKVPQSFCVE